jgi:hypothetical protein
LGRLNVPALHGLLLHRPEQLLGQGGQALYQALVSLKAAGLVQKIGISVYAPSELEMLASRYRFDLVQAPLNLLDRRLLTSGWLRRMKDDGVEVHVRSVFLQGLLLMSLDSIPAGFSRWSHVWSTWHDWLARENASAVATCVAFARSFQEIDRLVVGADSLSQLTQVIDAASDASRGRWPEMNCTDEDLLNPSRWLPQ